ncbi:uncharacterized protein LOC142317942 [Lycorma delicatula]|uniref:uncharacterized protein LOC142317942 n=1 Tax=Lycorma delicatula TaxID=130591 RepID=UPI003F50ED10
MNFVDKFDQLKTTYEIDHKSHKWWHRIFFYFIDAAVVNAFIIHKCLPVDRLLIKDFRREISFRLVSQTLVEARPGTSPSKSVAEKLVKRFKPNIPIQIRESGSNHQPKRSTRRCALCNKKTAKTDILGLQCIMYHFAWGNQKFCFQKYHTQ